MPRIPSYDTLTKYYEMTPNDPLGVILWERYEGRSRVIYEVCKRDGEYRVFFSRSVRSPSSKYRYFPVKAASFVATEREAKVFIAAAFPVMIPED